MFESMAYTGYPGNDLYRNCLDKEESLQHILCDYLTYGDESLFNSIKPNDNRIFSMKIISKVQFILENGHVFFKLIILQ